MKNRSERNRRKFKRCLAIKREDKLHLSMKRSMRRCSKRRLPCCQRSLRQRRKGRKRAERSRLECLRQARGNSRKLIALIQRRNCQRRKKRKTKRRRAPNGQRCRSKRSQGAKITLLVSPIHLSVFIRRLPSLPQ